MGRRINPIALRLKGQMNWPSNVHHPMLTDYIKHIFQKSMCGQPAIRASTTGIWVNVTVLATESHNPLLHNPLLRGNPVLQFGGAQLEEAKGRLETRTFNRTTQHSYYKPLFAKIDTRSLIQALAGKNGVSTDTTEAESSEQDQTTTNILNDESDTITTAAPSKGFVTVTGGPLAALHIYKDVPIYLKINVVQNALLRADIMAGLVAKAMCNGRSISRIHNDVLALLG
ncbi:hypothetical protein BATDEDRAFT_84752 [Batrachochytrium dendrobatidis JAM81]|uniref:Uncharacterized protein n=2 Tax=Batrachochytrium dendrobatidis TaxID=109871 RepID=F4NUP3_BATDJ|nr:uncharacterized protein BATDEDRAFT_84752 [Batrachochytrium dendrobatidis JAM81]EGF83207.1 hypothetical protein BATDEDRAFT_84752 [Batrachochytrium dendrobatidis JAM81]KAJ8325676.1 hypothetical protein O5D80_005876 [Batrachochytrium dendrobatidis]KAK5671345.1 hypothetical protein QVD99_002065 [Batrachochytrium dendrobatidis]OAJ36450.1 hypothetical protein BDEG_20621 [Batrachochytrium dendrobatidis JEL423]|eukprot:XP_006676018.1 hypothetical protein BATDEDRAFT_84752 [Batrachochytrium dendrobatidis JAM81]